MARETMKFSEKHVGNAGRFPGYPGGCGCGSVHRVFSVWERNATSHGLPHDGVLP